MPDFESNKSMADRVLALIHTKHPDYHPILAIAQLAHETDDDRLKFDCHRTIAKYVQPELKSVEVKASVTEHRRVIVSLFDVGGEIPATGVVNTFEGEVREVRLALPDVPEAFMVEDDPVWANLLSVEEAIAA